LNTFALIHEWIHIDIDFLSVSYNKKVNCGREQQCRFFNFWLLMRYVPRLYLPVNHQLLCYLDDVSAIVSDIFSHKYCCRIPFKDCTVGSRFATFRFTTVHFYDPCRVGSSTLAFGASLSQLKRPFCTVRF
jgi:hypothetical protein